MSLLTPYVKAVANGKREMTADLSRSPPLFLHFLILYVSPSFHSFLILCCFLPTPFSWAHLPQMCVIFNLVATRGSGKVQFDWRVMMMRTLEMPFAMSPRQRMRVDPMFQSQGHYCYLLKKQSKKKTHAHMETHLQHKRTFLSSCAITYTLFALIIIHTHIFVFVLLTPLVMGLFCFSFVFLVFLFLSFSLIL